ncbi:MAG TPA: helix-turn-helix transcriptional regulator [Humisphaera sp.]|nr:helix-turn-helix transcriptional regulator [Humisphaera sp.]
MDFQEKLRRRMEELGLNKARVAAGAGLTDSTISSYFRDRGSVPRIDIGIRIARVVKVPLDWLADDSQEWPPPEADMIAATRLSDTELFLEWCRRMTLAAWSLNRELKNAERIDWDSSGKSLAELSLDTKISSELSMLYTIQGGVQARRFVLDQFDMERPGSEFWRYYKIVEPAEGEELATEKLVKRHRALVAIRGYRAFFELEALRNGWDFDPDPKRHAELEKMRRKLLSELQSKGGGDAKRSKG